MSRRKLGFVIGDIPRPKVGEDVMDDWETCNGLVLSWIYNSVEPEIATILATVY